MYGGRAQSHVDSDPRFPSSSGALGSWDLGGRWLYLSGLQFSPWTTQLICWGEDNTSLREHWGFPGNGHSLLLSCVGASGSGLFISHLPRTV